MYWIYNLILMKIAGMFLVAWGFADLGLSWGGTDLYGVIGITLSETIYPFTHWIAMAIGYGLYSAAE